ncbi:hypothetical protein [Neomoorella mulderi]|nr:hypothetical protein [Moorella mulderi]
MWRVLFSARWSCRASGSERGRTERGGIAVNAWTGMEQEGLKSND